MEPCGLNMSEKFQQYLYGLAIKSNVTDVHRERIIEAAVAAAMAATADEHGRQNTSVSYDGRSDRDAVIYIVVVLCFYSFGIIFMMIKYMRREEKELEEFEIYKSFLKESKDSQYQMSSFRGRLTNRLALQALNTVNAIPQTNQVTSKVTFV